MVAMRQPGGRGEIDCIFSFRLGIDGIMVRPRRRGVTTNLGPE
jgi:hypothetical protein